MTNFCSKCGSPLALGTKFCAACGAANAAAPAVANASAPIVKSSGSAFKFVLIVVGVIAIVGVMALGSLVYVGYRVKKKADEYMQTSSTSARETSSRARHRVSRPSPCSLITKDEMSAILGTQFKEAAPDGNSCNYRGTRPTEWVCVDVDWENADAAIKGQKIMEKLAPGLGFSEEIAKAQPLDGIGDQAYMTVPNTLNVRKGKTFFSIDLRFYAHGEEKGKLLAEKALARLGS
jgi:hypothetical protein